MHILCSKSSIEFTCEHFPGYLSDKSYTHPIFFLPQRKLLPYLGKWSTNQLTPTDSYLLFLALLDSTDLVHWRHAAIRTENTPSIIAQNMERLAKVVSKINTVSNPAVRFPQYVISADTRNLENIKHWLENWDSVYSDFRAGKLKESTDRKLASREAALDRLVKNPHKPASSYAIQIADWSATAGSFPEIPMISPWSGRKITVKEYWMQIIIRAVKEESLASINGKHLKELLDHCEAEISYGSIYAKALFEALRRALERHKGFLDLGDYIPASSTNYEILPPGSINVENANISAMIQSAPTEKPVESNYPSRFKFIQAMNRWNLAQKYSQNPDSGAASGDIF